MSGREREVLAAAIAQQTRGAQEIAREAGAGGSQIAEIRQATSGAAETLVAISTGARRGDRRPRGWCASKASVTRSQHALRPDRRRARARRAHRPARRCPARTASPRCSPSSTTRSWTVRRAVVAALASLGDAAVRAAGASSCASDRDDETVLAAMVDALVASTGNVTDAAGQPGRTTPIRRWSPTWPRSWGAAQHRRRRPRAHRASPTTPTTTWRWRPSRRWAASAGERPSNRWCAAASSGNFFRVFPAIDVLGRSRRSARRAGRWPPCSSIGSTRWRRRAPSGRSGERSAVAPLAGLLRRGQQRDVRVGALALADLLERFRRTYGTAAPVEDALRKAVQTAPGGARPERGPGRRRPGEKAAIALTAGCCTTRRRSPLLATPAARRRRDGGRRGRRGPAQRRQPLRGRAGPAAARREQRAGASCCCRWSPSAVRRPTWPAAWTTTTRGARRRLRRAGPHRQPAWCGAPVPAARRRQRRGSSQAAVGAIQSLGSPRPRRWRWPPAARPRRRPARGPAHPGLLRLAARAGGLPGGAAGRGRPRARQRHRRACRSSTIPRAREALLETAKRPGPPSPGRRHAGAGGLSGPTCARRRCCMRGLDRPRRLGPLLRLPVAGAPGGRAGRRGHRPRWPTTPARCGWRRSRRCPTCKSRGAYDRAGAAAALGRRRHPARGAGRAGRCAARRRRCPSCWRRCASPDAATRWWRSRRHRRFDSDRVTCGAGARRPRPRRGRAQRRHRLPGGARQRRATGVLIELLRRHRALDRLHEPWRTPRPGGSAGLLAGARDGRRRDRPRC